MRPAQAIDADAGGSEMGQLLARCEVPYEHAAILSAGRDPIAAGGAANHIDGPNGSGISLEGADKAASLAIPNADVAITVASNKRATVRRERGAQNPVIGHVEPKAARLIHER